jgi:hypothetical protein
MLTRVHLAKRTETVSIGDAYFAIAAFKKAIKTKVSFWHRSEGDALNADWKSEQTFPVFSACVF